MYRPNSTVSVRGAGVAPVLGAGQVLGAAVLLGTAMVAVGCSDAMSSGVGTAPQDVSSPTNGGNNATGGSAVGPVEAGGATTTGGEPKPTIPDQTGFVDDDEPGKVIEDPSKLALDCTGVTQEPERIGGQVDVVFVIDNSSSMGGEIAAVEDRINEDFAKIIEDKGIDYRVIMLSRYGKVGDDIGHSNNPICIRAPLGAGTCVDPNTEVLANNPGKFYHFSADMRSREGLCDILEALVSPDEIEGPQLRPWPRQFDWVSIAPNGFVEFLRPRSIKHFIAITDDHSRCDRQGIDFNDRQSAEGGDAVARAFTEALVALAPEQFGSPQKPRFVFHSIMGMAGKPPGPDGIPPAWQPDEPIQLERCSDVGGAIGVDGNATAYQALSLMTGGLRYPSCYNDNFDAIFNAIAADVVNGVLSCNWEIPPPPDGQELDPKKVNLVFDPGGDPPPYQIPGVASAADCTDAGGWYYDDRANPTQVITCPSTCGVLSADESGKIDISFGCATEPPPRVAPILRGDITPTAK